MRNLYRWPENSEGRIYYYDNVKGVLIFLVILGHLFETYYDVSPVAKTGFVFIYLFHMPLFIFVSGIFSKGLTDRNNHFRIERSINLLILCVILLLVSRGLKTIILGVPFDYNFLTINSAAWFLFALAVWAGFTFLIKDIKPIVVISCALALSLYVGYLSFNTDFLVFSRVIVFYPFFLLGYYFDAHAIKKIVRKGWFLPAVVIAVVVIWILYNYQSLALIRPSLTGRNNYEMSLGPYSVLGPLVRLIYYPCTVLAGIIILNLIPRGKTFLSNYGERTLQIFFLQALFMPIFQGTFISVWVKETIPHYSILLILMACLLYIIFGLSIWKGFFDGILKYKWNVIKK
jgi:fucose 4-O-acetylase-like acetyltransferase